MGKHKKHNRCGVSGVWGMPVLRLCFPPRMTVPLLDSERCNQEIPPASGNNGISKPTRMPPERKNWHHTRIYPTYMTPNTFAGFSSFLARLSVFLRPCVTTKRRNHKQRNVLSTRTFVPYGHNARGYVVWRVGICRFRTFDQYVHSLKGYVA
jgi:hypothetical protein